MTKIAYIRASQQNPGLQFNQTPSSPIKSPITPLAAAAAGGRVFFQPPMPGSAPLLGAFNPQPPVARSVAAAGSSTPKPMLMAPTTRFNSNPTVILDDQANGRISKPLMEKRRRARINQCLSQLKQIVVDSAGQYTENNKCKLEKADILELTVKYVKKLHFQVDSPNSTTADHSLNTSNQSYLNGYSDCVRQISDFVAEVSDLSFRESLQSHLKQCLFSIQNSESANQCTSSPAVSLSQTGSTLPPSPPNSSSSSSVPFSNFCTPPSPAPSAESSLSSSSSASLSPLTLPHHAPMRGLKRQFSDDEEEASDEDEQDCFNTSGPINLCKISKGSDATWRPW